MQCRRKCGQKWEDVGSSRSPFLADRRDCLFERITAHSENGGSASAEFHSVRVADDSLRTLLLCYPLGDDPLAGPSGLLNATPLVENLSGQLAKFQLWHCP
jgi:hypothetical protein